MKPNFLKVKLKENVHENSCLIFAPTNINYFLRDPAA